AAALLAPELPDPGRRLTAPRGPARGPAPNGVILATPPMSAARPTGSVAGAILRGDSAYANARNEIHDARGHGPARCPRVHVLRPGPAGARPGDRFRVGRPRGPGQR